MQDSHGNITTDVLKFGKFSKDKLGLLEAAMIMKVISNDSPKVIR
jgi:hypothetical protein